MATSIEDCPLSPINLESFGNEHTFENFRSLWLSFFRRVGIFNPAIVVPHPVGMGGHRPSLPLGHVAQERYQANYPARESTTERIL